MTDLKIVSDCKLLNLPKIGDERDNLSIIEQLKQIPFEIKRYRLRLCEADMKLDVVLPQQSN